MAYDNTLIKVDVIRNDDITSEGLTVYTLLNSLTSNNEPSLFTTNSLLSYILCQDDENKAIKNGVIRGIKNLEDLGLIEVEEKTKTIKKITVVGRSLQKKDFYVVVSRNEMTNIFSGKDKKGICLFKLFKVYMTILSTFNREKKTPTVYKSKFCIMSQYYFQTVLNIKPSTFKKYIDYLVENKILYVGMTALRLADGSLNPNISNVYAKYQDKDLVNDYIGKYLGAIINEDVADKKKYNAKMGLYYSNYMNRGYKLSYEQLMELVDYCEKSTNEKYNVELLKEKIKKNLLTDMDLVDQQVEYELMNSGY